MTQDEIIDMGKQVGLWPAVTDIFAKELEAFAKLVAAKKQEAIIQIIKETPFSNWFQADVIEAIRARSGGE